MRDMIENGDVWFAEKYGQALTNDPWVYLGPGKGYEITDVEYVARQFNRKMQASRGRPGKAE